MHLFRRPRLFVLCLGLPLLIFSACTTSADETPPASVTTLNPQESTQQAVDFPLPLSIEIATPIPQQMLTGKMVLYSDFESADRNWLVGYENTLNAVFDEADGEYLISHDTPNYALIVEQGGPAAHIYQDVTLESMAVTKRGGKDAGLMLLCRVDGDSYYGVVVYHDGYYYLLRNLSGKQEKLTELDTNPSLNPGWNRLALSCQGEDIRFFANGSLVASVQDDNLKDGNVAVGVLSDKLTPATLGAFEYILVSLPDAGE